MTLVEKARALRPIIEKAVCATLSDTEALDAVSLFPAWVSGKSYATDDHVKYDGALYKCLQMHTSQADWTPTAAPSLWAKVLVPNPETIPEWEQPDSTNPYMAGDTVTHNGTTWVSDIDNNVWEPGVCGWSEYNVSA